jgi:hypothetical protein
MTYLVVLIPTIIYSVFGFMVIRHAKSLGLSIETNNPIPAYGIPIIIVLSAIFFIGSFLLLKFKEKLFKNCDDSSLQAALNGLRALTITAMGTGIYYIYTIKGVLYKITVQSDLTSTAQQKSGLPLFFVSIINYLFLLKHFGIFLLLMATAGLVILFINKHDRRWDISLLFMAGIAGIMGHAMLAHAAIYYIHYLIVPLAIAAVICIKPSCKTGIALILLISVISALSFVYPLTYCFSSIGGMNPSIERVFAFSSNVIPDRSHYPLKDTLKDIETNRIAVMDRVGDNPVPVLVWESPDFRYTVTGSGEIDRQMFEVTREYMKLDDIFIYSFDKDWETPLKILEPYPVFLIIGMKNHEKTNNERMIRSISSRNIKEISNYALSSDRMVYVYYLEPSDIEPAESEEGFENSLRRIQQKPGEKEDMTGPAGDVIRKR